jgi:hypothetical protein
MQASGLALQMRHLSWIPVSPARYVVFQPGRHSLSVIEMDGRYFFNLCRSAWGWFVEISSEIVRRSRRGSPDKEFSDALYVHSQIRPPWSAYA